MLARCFGCSATARTRLAPDGTIYIIYDYNRTPNGEVLMATFTEADVRAGKPVSDKVRLRGQVAQLPVKESADKEQP